MVNVKFTDGTIHSYEKGTLLIDIAQSISKDFSEAILSASIDDKVVDLQTPITKDCEVKFHTWKDDEGKSTFWHSSAHLMAEAIEILYPGVKFGIGPAIENGFYYDIDFVNYTITSDDFPKIEKKILELAAEKQKFIRKEVSKKEALDYFSKKGDEYKVELINELEDGNITFYQTGNFIDLCKGPHLTDTSKIKAVKLLNVAGAYWRGNIKNKQLTRIYGITFPTQKELDEYLLMLEEAKKRDHRKIGKELGLFTFSQKVGQGLPLWLPKGADLRERLIEFLKAAQKKSGYQMVSTPHIGHKELYVTSGHYEKYGKDSFQPISTPEEGEEFILKPMNCPHHCEIYKSSPRSYKELPIRLAEFGTVYRYEQSGELHGLTRVRGFTQDDAHIFCRPDQVKEEFKNVIDLVLYVFNSLGFNEYITQISLRDPDDKAKYIGTEENWDKAEKAIIEATAEKGLNTIIKKGEAAFYGPKLDFMVKDAIGRQWQLGTIQVDYNLPERFELEYVGADNQKHRPVMIHRAPFGSLERFIAILTEHCAGKFPLWLTPEQFIILPISEKFHIFAKNILNLLTQSSLRGSIDDRNEKIGKKIREAELQRIPYMIIIGEKEMNENKVSVRKQGMGDIGTFAIEDFVQLIREEINKSLPEFKLSNH